MSVRPSAFRNWFSPPRKRRHRGFAAPAAAELLEQRRLMTIINNPPFNGVHDFEVVGRASNGVWYSSSTDGNSAFTTQSFASWSPAVNWKDVISGDFDGDGLGDLAGRDNATGNWFTSLSDMAGSTLRSAGHWGAAAGWTDVMAADIAAFGDRNNNGDGDPNNFAGHFTHKTDIVGRDSAGTWWAAVSNGDGTFTTISFGHWAASAGWRDVKVADINGDGADDILGRTSTGQWWALLSKDTDANGEGISYENKFLGAWNPNAGWHDTTLTHDEIWSRTSTGAWWVLELPGDGTADTHFGAQWNEAAGWRDVRAVENGHQETDIVARTSTGQWWRMTPGGASNFIGSWNEAAGWRDVVVGANPDNETFDIAGRTSTGDWWVSSYNGSTLDPARFVGSWNPNAGWQNVRFERVTRQQVVSVDDVDPITGDEHIHVSIQAHRTGTQATMTEVTSAAGKQGIKIHYVSPAIGFTKDFFIFATTDNPAWDITFDGHVASDIFSNLSENISVHMRGWAGVDNLSSAVASFLEGGDGNDKIDGAFEM